MALHPSSRSAIVTGASRGFGLAVTRELTGAGWYVTVDGRNRDALRAVAAATGALAVPGDVTDPRHRMDLVAAALEATGSLDLVVNNAGALGPSPLTPLATCDLGELRYVFEANVFAPLALVQIALPYLRLNSALGWERGQVPVTTGAVLNVTSDAATEAYEGWGGYGASKAALEQWSTVLAVEEPELRVWWLDPGDMRTDMHQAAFPGEDISDRPLPAVAARAVKVLCARMPPSGRYCCSDLFDVEAAR